MAAPTLEFLSASTNGDPIKIAATATPGTLLHTATDSTRGADEIYIYISNSDTSERTVTIEWGGVTDPDHLICKAVKVPPNSGPQLVVSGLPLNNSNVVRAFASSANVLLAVGKVIRRL